MFTGVFFKMLLEFLAFVGLVLGAGAAIVSCTLIVTIVVWFFGTCSNAIKSEFKTNETKDHISIDDIDLEPFIGYKERNEEEITDDTRE